MGLFRNNFLALFLISLVACIVFIPLIGNCPLFDWDEVNFAECAREMIVSGNYSQVQLNFRPFWEKPPLFIWMQALSMNLFGINEFAARLPNAICSIATLCSLFLIGKRLHSIRFGLLWMGFYLCSLLPHFYFKTGIIDPWFNLLIFLSLFMVYRFVEIMENKKDHKGAALAGLFLGMAVLTKGPAALLIAALTILSYLIWSNKIKSLLTLPFVIFVFSTLFVSGSWFLIEWIKGNGNIIREFIDYQFRLAETTDAGHGGPFYYHFIVLLLGCFPASLVFAIRYRNYADLPEEEKHFRKLMICLFWTVLIIFSIVETKIVHYSSLCYFPLTFIAATAFSRKTMEWQPNKLSAIVYWFCVIILTLASVTVGLMKYLLKPMLEHGLIGDTFAAGNLSADVHWSGFEFLLGFVFLAGAILVWKALKKESIRALIIGLVLNLLFVILTINIIVPKAEMYTQGAAIAFYKSCKGRNCHVETHGFKSYAYVFYSDRRPEDYKGKEQREFIEKQLDKMETEGHSRIKSYATANQLWMEYGNVDRPAYIVARNTAIPAMESLPGMKKLYELNGYAFYVRMPAKPAK